MTKTIPFATISIVQKSTGIKYTTQSQADGYCNQLKPADDYEALELRTKDLMHWFGCYSDSIGENHKRSPFF
jgi:hypothetical protein